MSWWESLLPMAVIGGMLVVMGNIQYGVNKAMYGKPKHPGADTWDRLMEERDQRLLEEAAAASKGKVTPIFEALIWKPDKHFSSSHQKG